MIHGKTKIELYNPNTKIKKIIREENTFQSSVLQNYMKSCGFFNTNPFANSGFNSRSVWANVVGGIFLFKNAIDTSGGVVKYMPSGNQMIANGSYGVSNGALESDPPEMGSWNASESSASVNAINLVYDWATNQGNGTIGSICLTSKVGGYIGYGNASGKNKSIKSLREDQGSASFIGASSTEGIYRYYMGLFNGNLAVYKIYQASSSMSIFDGFTKTSLFDVEEVGDDVFGLAGRDNSNYISHFTDIIDGKIRFVPNIFGSGASEKTCLPNENYYYYEYDIENDTMSLKHFVNNSTKTLLNTASSNINLPTAALFFGDNVICVKATDGTVLFFNYLTGELLHYGNYYWNASLFPCELSDGLIQLPGVMDSPMWLLDTSNWTTKVTNANGLTVGKRLRFDGDCFLNSRNSDQLFKNPLYLATINNLQSPVTKTAAQTMKVTYTLTEA